MGIGNKDISFSDVQGNTQGLEGVLGGCTYAGYTSIDKNNHIYINEKLSGSKYKVAAAEIFSHEFYGHMNLFLQTNDPNQAGHDDSKQSFVEGNVRLKNRILESRRETVDNLNQ